MLGDEGFNSWSKFKLSDEDIKKLDTVFKVFHDGLGTDISHCNACMTLYNRFFQQKDKTATRLDIRLPIPTDKCQFPKPDDITAFLQCDIFMSTINYYDIIMGKPAA